MPTSRSDHPQSRDTPEAGPRGKRLRPPFARAAAIAAWTAVAWMLLAGPAAAAECMDAPAPKVDWRDCSKTKLIISGSDLSGANLAGADLSSTDLRNSNLAAADLEKATLVRASLAGSQAGKANFAKVEAYRADFSGVSAGGASFANGELERADFSSAVLTGSDFQKAELGRANFAGASLTGSRFTLANLSRADLRTAQFQGALDFAGAFLFLTRIEGVDLGAATGLQQWQIELACGDGKTKLPAGLKPPAGWPCTFD